MKRLIMFSVITLIIIIFLTGCAKQQTAKDQSSPSAPAEKKSSKNQQINTNSVAINEKDFKSSVNKIPTEIDCAENLDCFIVAAKTCASAKVKFNFPLPYQNNITVIDLLKIEKKTSEKCNLTFKIIGSNDDNLPKFLIGTGQTCLYTISDLVQVLSDWKTGNFSPEQNMLGNCQPLN